MDHRAPVRGHRDPPAAVHALAHPDVAARGTGLPVAQGHGRLGGRGGGGRGRVLGPAPGRGASRPDRGRAGRSQPRPLDRRRDALARRPLHRARRSGPGGRLPLARFADVPGRRAGGCRSRRRDPHERRGRLLVAAAVPSAGVVPAEGGGPLARARCGDGGGGARDPRSVDDPQPGHVRPRRPRLDQQRRGPVLRQLPGRVLRPAHRVLVVQLPGTGPQGARRRGAAQGPSGRRVRPRRGLGQARAGLRHEPQGPLAGGGGGPRDPGVGPPTRRHHRPRPHLRGPALRLGEARPARVPPHAPPGHRGAVRDLAAAPGTGVAAGRHDRHGHRDGALGLRSHPLPDGRRPGPARVGRRRHRCCLLRSTRVPARP
ncbi:MAG: hypothetical protein JWM89_1954 [Acidimicrobiales bacterium]|nr:hypothetical protein [Acidimicrobiales bacterium]